jgi:hypothetical protein
MAGRDPAIHVLLFDAAETWMPGTRPGVTGWMAKPIFTA